MGARTCGNMDGGNTMQDNIKKSESLKTDNFQKMVDQIFREDAELLEALKNLWDRIRPDEGRIELLGIAGGIIREW